MAKAVKKKVKSRSVAQRICLKFATSGTIPLPLNRNGFQVSELGGATFGNVIGLPGGSSGLRVPVAGLLVTIADATEKLWLNIHAGQSAECKVTVIGIDGTVIFQDTLDTPAVCVVVSTGESIAEIRLKSNNEAAMVSACRES